MLYEIQQLLIQIKSCAEVDNSQSSVTISQLSKYGLNLLHYTLFAIESQQTSLPLTSISAAAALHDIYSDLKPLANAYGVELKFDASPSLEPVYANKTSIQGSVYALVAGLITSINSNSAKDITIAVQQTKPRQQRIGVYSGSIEVNTNLIKKGISDIKGASRMNAPTITHRSGLGFAVSKELAERLNTRYHSFGHLSSKGIGYYLPESAQLSFL